MIEDFAASRGAEVLARFTEVESGRKAGRPELARALHLAKVTGATLVIAKPDRLSRNAVFLLALRDSGVRFVAVDMPEAATSPWGSWRWWHRPNAGNLAADQGGPLRSTRRGQHRSKHGLYFSAVGQKAGRFLGELVAPGWKRISLQLQVVNVRVSTIYLRKIFSNK